MTEAEQRGLDALNEIQQLIRLVDLARDIRRLSRKGSDVEFLGHDADRLMSTALAKLGENWTMIDPGERKSVDGGDVDKALQSILVAGQATQPKIPNGGAPKTTTGDP